MTAYTVHSSRPHESILPRSHRDAHQRFQTYGPIQSMDSEPGVFSRMFARLLRGRG